MKPENIRTIAICLLICGQIALTFHLLRQKDHSTEALQRTIKDLEAQIRQNEEFVERRLTEIQELADTITVIQQLRTTNHETYITDYAAIVAADSSQRAARYRDDYLDAVRKFSAGDRLFFPR